MIHDYMIIEEARSWVGTPFHHQAALKGVGCDCMGLIRGVFNVDLKGFASYPRNPTQRYVLTLMNSIFEPADGEPGDIVLLEIMPKMAVHLAILDYDNYIIHSSEVVGKVTKHRRLPTRWPIHSAWTYN